MEAFWDDHGYTLNSDGEGPFSLFYLPRRGPIRARLSEDADTDPVMQGATVLLSDFHLVSLVTPDDPVTDPFSASVRDDFLHCFRVRDFEYGRPVGTAPRNGPKIGWQTRVRVHMDGAGKIHGHPVGPVHYD